MTNLIKILQIAAVQLDDIADRQLAMDVLMDHVNSDRNVTLYSPYSDKHFSISSEQFDEICAQRHSKIMMIKAMRQTTGFGLREAKEAIEHPNNNFPI
tara:strand:+ start:3628 stop:3921 length:294 start_codon:yes stop_codon:yes gene_type:complete